MPPKPKPKPAAAAAAASVGSATTTDQQPQQPVSTVEFIYKGKKGSEAEAIFSEDAADFREKLQNELMYTHVVFRVRQHDFEFLDTFITLPKDSTLYHLQLEISSRLHLGAVSPLDITILKPGTKGALNLNPRRGSKVSDASGSTKQLNQNNTESQGTTSNEKLSEATDAKSSVGVEGEIQSHAGHGKNSNLGTSLEQENMKNISLNDALVKLCDYFPEINDFRYSLEIPSRSSTPPLTDPYAHLIQQTPPPPFSRSSSQLAENQGAPPFPAAENIRQPGAASKAISLEPSVSRAPSVVPSRAGSVIQQNDAALSALAPQLPDIMETPDLSPAASNSQLSSVTKQAQNTSIVLEFSEALAKSSSQQKRPLGHRFSAKQNHHPPRYIEVYYDVISYTKVKPISDVKLPPHLMSSRSELDLSNTAPRAQSALTAKFRKASTFVRPASSTSTCSSLSSISELSRRLSSSSSSSSPTPTLLPPTSKHLRPKTATIYNNTSFSAPNSVFISRPKIPEVYRGFDKSCGIVTFEPAAYRRRFRNSVGGGNSCTASDNGPNADPSANGQANSASTHSANSPISKNTRSSLKGRLRIAVPSKDALGSPSVPPPTPTFVTPLLTPFTPKALGATTHLDGPNANGVLRFDTSLSTTSGLRDIQSVQAYAMMSATFSATPAGSTMEHRMSVVRASDSNAPGSRRMSRSRPSSVKTSFNVSGGGRKSLSILSENLPPRFMTGGGELPAVDSIVGSRIDLEASA
jgi:hypothetical protein